MIAPETEQIYIGNCKGDERQALLEKAGFRQEGYRVGAILKHGQLRDIREFGLLL